MTVTVGAKKPQLPDYFPVKVGDWWLYRSITADGKQSEFTLKVLNRELQPDMSYWYVVGTVSAPWAPIKDWYTKPKGWVVVHREAYPNSGQSVDFLPVRPLIMNPLKAGQVWHWSGPGMLGVSRSEKNEVLGPEEVMVPAGKFTAMKVVTSVVQGGAPVSKVYWYAPFVGLVKSMTESSGVKSSTVLLDYNFRKRTMPEWAAEVGVETSKQEYKLPPCEE